MARNTLDQLVAAVKTAVYQNTEAKVTGQELQDLLVQFASDTYIELLNTDQTVADVNKLNFVGTGIVLKQAADTLTIEVDKSVNTIGNHFVGIYQDLQPLKDAIASPATNFQAIVLTPSEKYYHGVGNAWVELAPVSAFHPNYLGVYDTIDDLKLAQPSPSADSLAIVGTAEYTFYIYANGKWDMVTHTDLPALTKRVEVAEGHIQTLQSAQTAMSDDITQLQNDQFSGLKIEDEDGNSFSDIKSLAISGATVTDSGATDEVNVNISPKITVANDPDLINAPLSKSLVTDRRYHEFTGNSAQNIQIADLAIPADVKLKGVTVMADDSTGFASESSECKYNATTQVLTVHVGAVASGTVFMEFWSIHNA